MLEAKIIGITPDILTLIGMWVFCPPYILLPTTRLAYCTGMRRSASVIQTMKAITSKNITTIPTTANCLSSFQ